jgi:hypothetical protein
VLVASADCYSDDRFNQEHDKKTGFRTNNMLAMPIKAGEVCPPLSSIASTPENFASDILTRTSFVPSTTFVAA